MGALADSKPCIVICTTDRARSADFYRAKLGLTQILDDIFAATFDVGGVSLRVSAVPGFASHNHTIAGFHVSDVEATVRELARNGVTFNFYEQFTQDALGIWTAPGDAFKVAWFQDPDGNVLSVTNA